MSVILSVFSTLKTVNTPLPRQLAIHASPRDRLFEKKRLGQAVIGQTTPISTNNTVQSSRWVYAS